MFKAVKLPFDCIIDSFVAVSEKIDPPGRYRINIPIAQNIKDVRPLSLSITIGGKSS